MGRNRLGKEATVSITFSVEPELREALKDEAYRAGKSLSQMGSYALQRWLNAQEHVRESEEINACMPQNKKLPQRTV
jgi:hypothetical protein